MIKFQCNQCGAAMQAPDSLAGQNENCPECGFPNRVPQPSVSQPGSPLPAQAQAGETKPRILSDAEADALAATLAQSCASEKIYCFADAAPDVDGRD